MTIWTDEQLRMRSRRMKRWCVEHPDKAQLTVERMQMCSRYWNTKPEQRMKIILEQLNIEFISQGKIRELVGRDKYHPFDFLIPSLKIAIEVDGCLWHRCSIHCPDSQFGDPEGEKRRDDEARLLGWKVFRVWEHDLVGDSDEKVRKNLEEIAA